MSLSIASLNSGSNGNCYYVGNEQEAVLIDAGISCKETEKRMTRLRLPMSRIKAIFITHEHIDHVKGLEVLSVKFQIPVFITNGTLSNSNLRLPAHLVNAFIPYRPIAIGGLSVNPFPKRHDAADAHSFTVSGNGVTIGVLTDIGSVCEHVAGNFNQCHAVFLEANYDEEMLENGKYPYFLKNRIRAGYGHLSNSQSLSLFLQHKAEHLSLVLLAHLSKDNNHPQLVEQLFRERAGPTEIGVASRFGESELYRILPEQNELTVTYSEAAIPAQLELF